MKRLFFFTCALFFTILVQAQITVNVSGTVINVDGSPAENVAVYITTDSLINWPGYYNMVTTLADGTYSDSYEVPDQITQGALWISIIDCDFSWLTQQTSWFPGGSPTADFIYCENPNNNNCSVSIVIDTVDCISGEVPLYGAVVYNGNISYAWSNGDDTQYTTATSSGTYCLSITDASGCTDVDCIDISIPGNCDCDVSIEANPANGLLAFASGTPPFTYSWNTGEATASISPNASGNYCVSITDAVGCEASDCYYLSGQQDTLCYVYLTLEVTPNNTYIIEAIGGGVPPYTYAWNTGATTSGIEVSEGGFFCVTITDATGCSATACEQFTNNFCDIEIEVDPNIGLTAIGSGNAPYVYFWSTGETGSTILPLADGTYCVSLIDADSCFAVACADWGDVVIDTSCYVNIIQSQGGNLLEALGDGTPPFTYAWSTGDVQSYIFVNAPGTYCVTLTDADGCEASTCYDYLTEPDNFGINGGVYLPDSNFIVQLSGWVYLYELTENSAELADSVEISSTPNGSWYAFEDVPAGEYIVRAVLGPDSPGYDDYLPTYYGNVLWWNEAAIITIPYTNFSTYSITMIEANNPGGPGLITGSIIDPPTPYAANAESRNNDPLADISIFLLDMDDNPIDYRMTASGGGFMFDGLAWGTYQVYVEIPGVEQAFYIVTIGPDHPEVTDLVFVFGENSVTSLQENSFDKQVLLYPNPVQDQLNLGIKGLISTRINIQITDLLGRTFLQKDYQLEAGQQNLTFNLANLPNGVYLLNIYSNHELFSKKFIK